MKRRIGTVTIFALVLISSVVCHAENVVELSPHVSVRQNSTNGVFIKKDGQTLVVYGDPGGSLKKADKVLFTHSRRDVVWAGRPLVENGAESVVPVREADNFSKACDFWESFAKARFHDYQQQTTKIPTEPLRVNRKVSEGDTINWQNLTIKVLDTPGYTRGSVSYFVNVDDIKYGFVGDIIFGDGQLFDLYSLQDAVDDAKIGGYHGYAGRLGELIKSLRKIINQNPDILVPARGPVIRNPKAAVERLIQRLQSAYKNYLSINAGHWYFKDRYEILAARVLEPNDKVDWMPYAETIRKKPPDWIVPIHNSRLVLSESKAGFLVDCGSRAIIDEIIKLRDSGRLSLLEGLFITHYHDDHTNEINELIKEFKCPVYAGQDSKDILENPHAYRLPAMTSKGIPNLTAVPDGHKMRWKEFDFTFYYFPGQTLYHDALLVEKNGGEKIFFIGDSFTPSGIDDYCLQNRNLLQQGMGYFYCLAFLRKMPPDYLLINQHVVEPFRYNQEQIEHMILKLEERKRIFAKLFPWDEPNYGIDERWARIYPYGQKIKPGQNTEITVKIFNHSNSSNVFTVSLNVPKEFRLKPEKSSINIQPRKEGKVRFEITLPDAVSKKVYVITSDIKFDKWDLRHWSEAILEVYTE
jgi:glyoxylase-like metal-dependent hydrolase (beta-lactamase superfamily II)